VPSGDPVGGLLVCSPLHVEFGKNYRREVLLARQLAARGVLVHRFHYRGTGHSAGDSTGVTMDTLVEDALTATQHTEALLGQRPLAFLGTRLGALVAGVAAGRRPASPFMMWEPSGSARQHFRAVFRAGIIRGLKSGDDADGPAQFSLARLESVGQLDVLGYPITWQLYQSLAGASIPTGLGEGSRPVQIVQFGGRAIRADLSEIVEHVRCGGATVSVEYLDVAEAWWFGGTGDASGEIRAAAHTLADMSSRWLGDQLTEVGLVSP
jgi:pimeloyl-ACP methyl ester carboxylesterase